MMYAYNTLLDEFDTVVFFQPSQAEAPTSIPLIDIPKLETKIAGPAKGWICGYCGRRNVLTDSLCRSCGALPSSSLHKGYARLEGWLPAADILYSLNAGFTLYINRVRHGRYDVFQEDEIVFKLIDCAAGPVQARRLVKLCREEGSTPEMVRVSCDVACTCVYVGAPWRKDEEMAEQNE